jgi:hypothetical protein
MATDDEKGNDLITALVVAKYLFDFLTELAQKSGYTQADLDVSDARRAVAIDKFKEAAGLKAIESPSNPG